MFTIFGFSPIKTNWKLEYVYIFEIAFTIKFWLWFKFIIDWDTSCGAIVNKQVSN